MKNLFLMTACRFHLKNENSLLVMGNFSDNCMGNNHPIITLDDTELTYEVEERRLLPHCHKQYDGKEITKEYYLWVELPADWEQYQQLSVWNDFESGKELVMHVKKEKLLELKQWIPRSVDRVERREQELQIQGWYISNGETELNFYDSHDKCLSPKIKKNYRGDVLKAYPECQREDVVGFQATFTGHLPQQMRMQIKIADKEINENISLKKQKKQRERKWNTEWLVKARAYYRQFGMKATIERVGDKLFEREYSDYQHWLRRNYPSKGVLIKQRKEKFGYMPKISIVIPLYKTPEKYLKEVIASVQNQSYSNWELCLSDGSGKNSPLTKTLKNYEKADKRIRVVHNEKQLHISDNTNEALKICTGDFIGFADHDDLLMPNALYEVVRVLNEYPEMELIYSDEDKVNEDGTEYFQPHFKSDFNLDMLRSTNYLCHLVVVKHELYEKVGLLKAKYDGAQDHDFVLRCVEKTSNIYHIPKILYHWRSHRDSTAESGGNKTYIVKAGIGALQDHYERVGINATVCPTRIMGTYRTKYKLESKPLVSIIIPNKDHISDLKKCIYSLDHKNAYYNVEYIIVENNSECPETFEYYEQLVKKNKRARVVYWKGKGFNYPAINTFGVQYAKGDYLLFLNNDTEIINKRCIEELMGYCTREDVGVVGAKMYYDDGTIQHAGVIVGMGGVAGHAFVGMQHDAPAYFGRAVMAQDLSAVTAACMMVKKHVYEEVDGFDEAYAVAFNDVDFCMKVRKAGYLIVYNPYAELIHHESKSRGYEDTDEKIERFNSEVQLFQERWKDALDEGDPYYNPHLSLDVNDFSMNLK